jgi:hypothetical protein
MATTNPIYASFIILFKPLCDVAVRHACAVKPQILWVEYSKRQPHYTHKQQTPWPESASELYQPSNRCLSAKLVQTFGDE